VLLLLPKYVINILQVWQQLLDESHCLLHHPAVNAAAATISAVVLLTMTGLSSTALL
jgi:hypothetical protein